MTLAEIINEIMIPNMLSAIVWDWDSCPLEEKWSCGHGGDEDDVILYKSSCYRMETAVKSMAICSYNEKEYGEYTLAVTAHA